MRLFNRRALTATTLLPLLATLGSPAFAVAINENLDIGGAIRARIDYDPDQDLQKLVSTRFS